MADFGFLTLEADYEFWALVADFGFWTIVPVFLFKTLVADFLFWVRVFLEFGHQCRNFTVFIGKLCTRKPLNLRSEKAAKCNYFSLIFQERWHGGMTENRKT